MKTKIVFAAVFSLAMLLSAAQAQAIVMIDITGTPGSGVTTWTFSGSETVTGNPLIIDDDDDLPPNFAAVTWGWHIGPDFFSLTGSAIGFTSTTAMIDGPVAQYDILGFGTASSGAEENLGIFIVDPAEIVPNDSYEFPVGSVLSFSGIGVAPLDISLFAPGVTTAAFHDSSLGAPNLAGFDVQFTVTALPLPSTLALLMGGFVAAGIAARWVRMGQRLSKRSA